MEVFRVSLFGHRDFNGHRALDDRLYPMLRDLLSEKEFVEIFIGRNGEFDIYAASVIKKLQRALGKESLVLICVLPYPVKDLEYYDAYYDSVVIPDESEKGHPKSAISARNRWMVKQSDMVICYVERQTGGAYEAIKYAKMLEKEVINLASTEK